LLGSNYSQIPGFKNRLNVSGGGLNMTYRDRRITRGGIAGSLSKAYAGGFALRRRPRCCVKSSSRTWNKPFGEPSFGG
jgi:hypothetical protein